MRIDITEERKQQVLGWTKVTAYKKLSTKAVTLLSALNCAKEDELTRPDLFRAAGHEANARTSGDQPNTDMTDYRLFATGLLDMRATGVEGNQGYNGVITYWTLSDKGKTALDTALRDQLNKMWKHIPI